MKGIPINVRKREGKKKGYVRKLRAKGIIPGVLYGPDEPESTLVEFDEREIESIFRKHKTSEHFLVSFDLGSRKNVQAFIKDVQYDPITGRILHVDLEAVSTKEPMVVEVPLEFVGVSEGVKKGGVFTTFLRELEVKGLVDRLPDVITVDISHLDLGDTLHIRDIKVEEIVIMHEPDEPVATIAVPRIVEEKVAAQATVESQAPAQTTQEVKESEKK